MTCCEWPSPFATTSHSQQLLARNQWFWYQNQLFLVNIAANDLPQMAIPIRNKFPFATTSHSQQLPIRSNFSFAATFHSQQLFIRGTFPFSGTSHSLELFGELKPVKLISKQTGPQRFRIGAGPRWPREPQKQESAKMLNSKWSIEGPKSVARALSTFKGSIRNL